MRAGGLGGGPGKMEESKRKHFSVSLAGSPTKPLTPAVGQFLAQKSPAGENIAWKNHFHGINHFRL